jgi:hypothetical protein
MTEAEIEAAAGTDPDARPMTAEELRTAGRIPRIRTLRRALGLTQEEFAGRYHTALFGTGSKAARSRINRHAPILKRSQVIQRRCGARLQPPLILGDRKWLGQFPD